eukprot:1124078-Alexandrium_andersonii.AAC.1
MAELGALLGLQGGLLAGRLASVRREEGPPPGAGVTVPALALAPPVKSAGPGGDCSQACGRPLCGTSC